MRQVQLQTPDDARSFTLGSAIEISSPDGRHWRRATRWERISGRWLRRFQLSAVDVERGVITIVATRWSWRRWRWEEQR